MKRQHHWQRMWLLSFPLLLQPHGAWANEQQQLTLNSDGGYTSYRLPDDTTQVDLSEQTQGACRFNRTWGYDLSNRELWTNQGCGGRFLITRERAHEAGSNTGAAVAAVAAIAGLALLASRDRHDDDKTYRPPNSGGADWGRGNQIRVDGGLCLDVVKGNLRPGNPVQVYSCNGSSAQRFNLTRSGEIQIGNLCLDVESANSNDGARAIVWSCSGAPNQRWSTRGSQIISRLNGKCLDVADGRIRPGQQVILWSCNGGANQRWWW